MGDDTAVSRVLVIEDDVDIQQALAQVLADDGYNVECASDGAEGLSKVRAGSEKPAVIILDMWMPGMDGFAFRRAQLDLPETAEIPVVVVTAAGVAPTEMAALGLAYVLRKPVDLDILLRVVRRLSSRVARATYQPHPHA
jgi:DNA-binding response OmpR family regulator